MKGILVCVIVIVVSMGIIAGCLSNNGSNRQKNQDDSPYGNLMDKQLVESIPGYGYALLQTNSKGGNYS